MPRKIPGQPPQTLAKLVNVIYGSITMAEFAAGKALLAAHPKVNPRVISIRTNVRVADAAGLTTAIFRTTDASPVAILTLAVAQMTNGAILTSDGETGTTIGAGFNAALGLGVGINAIGASASGTGIVDYIIEYVNTAA